MAEDQVPTVRGTVTEALANAMYRVELDKGPPVTAHVGRAMQLKFVRLRPGDRVLVEVSRYDLSRGRIVRQEP